MPGHTLVYLRKTGTVVKAWPGERQCEEVLKGPGPMPVERMEFEYIQKILQQNDGKVTVTARSPGVYRLTLQENWPGNRWRNENGETGKRRPPQYQILSRQFDYSAVFSTDIATASV